MSQQFEQLKDILVKNLKVAPELIISEATWQDLEMDSLAMVELSLMLEQELGVGIADEELLELATIGDLVGLLEQRTAAV
jgi:acyl carrier protein